MRKSENSLRNILIIVGFVAAIAAVAGGVFWLIKFFERRREDQIFDCYFDEDDYMDEFDEQFAGGIMDDGTAAELQADAEDKA